MTSNVPPEAIEAARRAFATVMDTWNGRHGGLAGKLDAAWQAAAPLIAAAERERIAALLAERALNRAWAEDLHAGGSRTQSAIADLLREVPS